MTYASTVEPSAPEWTAPMGLKDRILVVLGARPGLYTDEIAAVTGDDIWEVHDALNELFREGRAAHE